MIDKDWNIFESRAKNQLTAGIEKKSSESFIELLHEPSFEPSTFLQLVWKNDSNTRWYLATWDRQLNWDKFFNPIEKLKYVGSEIQPLISTRTGTLVPETLTPIVEVIQNLSIKPRLDKLKVMTLDGSNYDLCFGVDDLHCKYSWHTMPEEWISLRKVVDMLLNLQNELDSH